MRKLTLVLALVGPILGAVGMFVVSSEETAAAASGPCDTSNYNAGPNEQQLFGQVNSWRASAMAMPAMQLSAPASKAAQWFAEAMIAGTTSSHSDQNGRSWVQRLRDCGYDSYWAGGSGEALAGFGSSDPNFGSTPEQALANMTASTPGHQNGVQAAVPWQCAGVGYWMNSNPKVGQLRYAWVVIVAQYSSTNCPQAVAGGGGTPAGTSTATPGTPSATATPTRTPTPSPTPTPVVYRVLAPLVTREIP
jgi:uncharacterized protein YkwD